MTIGCRYFTCCGRECQSCVSLRAELECKQDKIDDLMEALVESTRGEYGSDNILNDENVRGVLFRRGLLTTPMPPEVEEVVKPAKEMLAKHEDNNE